MLSIIKRILAVICTSVLFFSCSTPVSYGPIDENNLNLTAVFISDVHIEGNNTDRYNRFGKTLTGIFASEQNIDALLFAGDNTMNGQNIEWFDFYGILCRYNKAKNTLVGFGNHDFGNVSDHDTYLKLAPRCIKQYNNYMGEHIDNVYYSKIINGYRFIMMASDDNAEDTVQVISDKQIEWLKNELAEAAADNKPAFIVNHNLLYGKNGTRSRYYFNQTTNNDAIVSALENCGTNVFYFCGHSHFGVNSGSVNTEGNVTYINLPSAGNVDNFDSEGINSDATNGCVTEVYDDNIILRFRNFGSGKWIENFDKIEIPLK